jgi:hypothetical protein
LRSCQKRRGRITGLVRTYHVPHQDFNKPALLIALRSVTLAPPHRMSRYS